MQRIGIRELRLNLGDFLARVKAGSTLAVTDRDRPVTLLKPLASKEDAWQQLVTNGVVVPAAGT